MKDMMKEVLIFVLAVCTAYLLVKSTQIYVIEIDNTDYQCKQKLEKYMQFADDVEEALDVAYSEPEQDHTHEIYDINLALIDLDMGKESNPYR